MNRQSAGKMPAIISDSRRRIDESSAPATNCQTLVTKDGTISSDAARDRRHDGAKQPHRQRRQAHAGDTLDEAGQQEGDGDCARQRQGKNQTCPSIGKTAGCRERAQNLRLG